VTSSGPDSWLAMVDTMRRTACLKPPVLPGMYRSLYKKDYQWYEEHKPLNEEDTQIADSQLKAKEFAIPQEEQAMTCSDSIAWRGRGVIPAPSIKASRHADDTGGRKPEGNASSPKALQQRKRFTSVLPVAESDLPKYYPATELEATQAEKSERPWALPEPENELSYCQHPPAAAQTAGTAGMLLRRQRLALDRAAYKQFVLETCRATQRDARQNRSMILGSSVLVEECFDRDWRSTYNTDFQHWQGAHGGYCRGNKNLSHVFTKDEHLNQ
ncbi:hypothetical protein N340_06381, partial [Tauraco erythrolophus]